jgi:hypothetical protein
MVVPLLAVAIKRPMRNPKRNRRNKRKRKNHLKR